MLLHLCILTAGFIALVASSVYTFLIVRDKNLTTEEVIPAVLFGTGLFGALLMLKRLCLSIIGGFENVDRDILLTCMCWLCIVGGLLTNHHIRIQHVHRIKSRG